MENTNRFLMWCLVVFVAPFVATALLLVNIAEKQRQDVAELRLTLDTISANVEAIAVETRDDFGVAECRRLIVDLGLETAESADDARLWERARGK
jgi:hypothetical protein